MTESEGNGTPISTGEGRAAPEHLNASGLRIRYTEGKGRGVYSTRAIPAQTVIEISPVLLFTAQEYADHGRHTVLDHYTFVWRDGRMALALGLGSLFNHSQQPNVSYSIDAATESIRYTTSRTVLPGEELCIFYGHKLWFDPVDAADRSTVSPEPRTELDDGWGGLLTERMDDDLENPFHVISTKFGNGNPDSVVSEAELPFKRMKLTPEDDEEEDMDAVKKEDAWVVDLPDPRFAAPMLKWLKQSGFDTASMAHLKRIRKLDDKMSMVVILCREHPKPPTLPENVELPPPYVVTVAKTTALTPTSLKLKSSLWPTIYAPRKKFEPEPWTRGKVRWACDAMAQVVEAARLAGAKGELPIAAYVPVPFEDETRDTTQLLEPISAHDTRKSACHPLRHSIINLVRDMGERRASTSAATSSSQPPTPLTPQLTPIADIPTTDSRPHVQAAAPEESEAPEAEARNGAHYLLTSLTLFTTHEPCIMCSMALLHSRVKEVFYLLPMEKTGGCGSVTCVPRLEGVNHRYAVNVWRSDGGGGAEADMDMDGWAERCGLKVYDACDA